ncbi:MAG: glycoside hydrolase family 73 protein [Terriglobia bacterium]
MTRQHANFLHDLVPAAQRIAARYGLPASVVLAQAILESNWGRSQLARKAKNLFGIKAVSRHADAITLPTTEYDRRGRRRVVPARFAAYTNVEDCLADYGRLLAFASRYAPARAVADDPFAFAEQLVICGYATDPGYAKKIARLIRRYKLTQFDSVPPGTPRLRSG